MSVIDGTTKFIVKTGNEAADRVLVSDSSGLADWVGVRSLYTSEHYVGELYGGGIVVGVWVEGGDEKVLIAALQDGTSTSQVFPNPPTASPLVSWSAYTTTLANATSLYDGRSNYSKARSLYGFTVYALTRAAVDIDTVPGGYIDWYLPSLYEMKMVYDAAAVINRTLKQDNNFKFDAKNPGTARYWTSTEANSTDAWLLDYSTNGTFVLQSKTTEARIRPVRLERKAVNNGLVTNLDVTNKLSYNDSTLTNRWVDLANYGLTSSYSFTFASTNSTGPTYSPLQGGYLRFNGSSYVDFVAPIGDTDVVTVEMWLRLGLTPGAPILYTMLFGWSIYSVFVDGYGNIGYNTGNGGDTFGLSAALVDSLGLWGNWNHYVFEMRSGTYANNKIYVNGVQQTLTQSGDENPANANFGGGLGRISSHRSSTTYLATYDISVFKVYRRALTFAEVQEGYNKYRRKYEIGVPSSHFLDSGAGSGTFSITQNLVLDLQGKKNLKVLRSDGTGLSSWVEKNYLFFRPDNQKFVGEVYGGGIIVSSWSNPANVFNYLIMSKTDVNIIVAELRYGGNVPTRLMATYDFTSWLSVGQPVKLTIAGTLVDRTISSIVSETGSATVSSGTLNLAISDGLGLNVPGTALVSPALFVDLQFVPTLIEVVVNISHTFVGDLVINLVAPNGKVINLFNRQNGSNDNLTNTVFSSNLALPGITSGTSPYTGTFRMNAASGVTTGGYTSNVTTLSALVDGKPVNGNWYLVVVDGDVGQSGTLVNWSLRFGGKRTTILLNETRTATVTYQSLRQVQIGSTGLLVPWSSVTLGALSTNNNFDGSMNVPFIVSQTGHTHSAALLADYYTSDGFGDWYLPSAFELQQAFGNLAAAGYVYGTAGVPEGEYWSSTQAGSANAYTVGFTAQNGSAIISTAKSSFRRVRAFRQVKVLANYKSWGDNEIWSEPTGDWYINPWDEANWGQYAGIRQSNLVFHFNTDNLQSYRGLTAGLTPVANSLVGGYTGTVLGQVAWSSDRYALEFNGVQAGVSGGNATPTDSYLDFGTALALQSIPITLEAWIYPTYTTDTGFFKGIFSTCVPSGTGNWYGINLYISRNSNGTYNVGIFWANGNGTSQATDIRHGFTSNGPVLPNQWSHVVGVMTGYNEISIYVNGKYVNTSLSGSSTSIGLNAAGKTMIGNFPGNVKYIFGGSIGAVRCYNTGLSATDVKNNFEKDRVRYGL